MLTSNSDPKLIGGYFVKAVDKLGGCPRRVRADRGTENGIMKDIQTFLRRDHPDGLADERSFIYGKSTTNQRIEAWWGILRKENAQYWINVFSASKEDGSFTGSFLDKGLIQFCFMQLVHVSQRYNVQSSAHLGQTDHRGTDGPMDRQPTVRPRATVSPKSLYALGQQFLLNPSGHKVVLLSKVSCN